MPSLSELQPGIQPYARYLVAIAGYYGLGPVSVNSVFRSRRDQELLYSRYQRGLSQYPVAPPGTSLHEQRRAFDMNVRQGGRSPEQAWLGRVWQSWGGKWSPQDPIHFYV